MRRAVVACMLLAMASCGSPYHLSHRLAKGSAVMIVEPEEVKKYRTCDRADIATLDFRLVVVKLGTKALVVRDDGPTEDAMRQVIINIKDGEHSGTVGKIARYQLQVVAR